MWTALFFVLFAVYANGYEIAAVDFTDVIDETEKLFDVSMEEPTFYEPAIALEDAQSSTYDSVKLTFDAEFTYEPLTDVKTLLYADPEISRMATDVFEGVRASDDPELATALERMDATNRGVVLGELERVELIREEKVKQSALNVAVSCDQDDRLKSLKDGFVQKAFDSECKVSWSDVINEVDRQDPPIDFRCRENFEGSVKEVMSSLKLDAKCKRNMEETEVTELNREVGRAIENARSMAKGKLEELKERNPSFGTTAEQVLSGEIVVDDRTSYLIEGLVEDKNLRDYTTTCLGELESIREVEIVNTIKKYAVKMSQTLCKKNPELCDRFFKCHIGLDSKEFKDKIGQYSRSEQGVLMAELANIEAMLMRLQNKCRCRRAKHTTIESYKDAINATRVRLGEQVDSSQVGADVKRLLKNMVMEGINEFGKIRELVTDTAALEEIKQLLMNYDEAIRTVVTEKNSEQLQQYPELMKLMNDKIMLCEYMPKQEVWDWGKANGLKSDQMCEIIGDLKGKTKAAKQSFTCRKKLRTSRKAQQDTCVSEARVDIKTALQGMQGMYADMIPETLQTQMTQFLDGISSGVLGDMFEMALRMLDADTARQIRSMLNDLMAYSSKMLGGKISDSCVCEQIDSRCLRSACKKAVRSCGAQSPAEVMQCIKEKEPDVTRPEMDEYANELADIVAQLKQDASYAAKCQESEKRMKLSSAIDVYKNKVIGEIGRESSPSWFKKLKTEILSGMQSLSDIPVIERALDQAGVTGETERKKWRDRLGNECKIGTEVVGRELSTLIPDECPNLDKYKKGLLENPGTAKLCSDESVRWEAAGYDKGMECLENLCMLEDKLRELPGVGEALAKQLDAQLVREMKAVETESAEKIAGMKPDAAKSCEKLGVAWDRVSTGKGVCKGLERQVAEKACPDADLVSFDATCATVENGVTDAKKGKCKDVAQRIVDQLPDAERLINLITDGVRPEDPQVRALLKDVPGDKRQSIMSVIRPCSRALTATDPGIKVEQAKRALAQGKSEAIESELETVSSLEGEFPSMRRVKQQILREGKVDKDMANKIKDQAGVTAAKAADFEKKMEGKVRNMNLQPALQLPNCDKAQDVLGQMTIDPAVTDDEKRAALVDSLKGCDYSSFFTADSTVAYRKKRDTREALRKKRQDTNSAVDAAIDGLASGEIDMNDTSVTDLIAQAKTYSQEQADSLQAVFETAYESASAEGLSSLISSIESDLASLGFTDWLSGGGTVAEMQLWVLGLVVLLPVFNIHLMF